MLAVVYRSAFGPFQVWVLGGAGEPETARLPGEPDPGAAAFYAKGTATSWEDWGRYLADTPSAGNWAVEDVPDGSTAHQALVFIRRRDILRSLG